MKFLGNKLGLTKNTYLKNHKTTNKYGIEVEAKTNLRYRIPGGLELLDKKLISKYIDTKYMYFIDNMIIFDELPSTNNYLADLIKIESTESKEFICIAESQSAGKGRLGRQWFSPYARNIYLSLGWNFLKEPNELNGLSLAIAIAVIEALEDYGIKKNIVVKWPNDIIWRNRKLAGILIEFYSKANHIYSSIIGIGLNVNMSGKLSQKIDHRWCSISQIIERTPQRNKLVAILLNRVLTTLIMFQKNGLTPFLNKWNELDFTYGKNVTIIIPQQQKILGIGCGIDKQGHFLLKDRNNNMHSFAVGEVSLRCDN